MITSTIEIKEELYKYIEIGDKQFIDKLYQRAKSYMEQIRLDRMISEGEEDIKAGRLKIFFFWVAKCKHGLGYLFVSLMV